MNYGQLRSTLPTPISAQSTLPSHGRGQRRREQNDAGYLTITNNGSTADRLSCVSSDASAKCQVHTMTMENGVMKMRPAEGGLEIKPGETVMLKPSSAHLMFLDLKHPLEQGNTVAATLQFERAGTTQVEFPSPRSERRPPALRRARQHR